MLAGILGGFCSSHATSIVEYPWEYVRRVMYFILYFQKNEYSYRNSCRAFFTVMTSLFLPANLPVQMFLFVSTYLMHPVTLYHYTLTDNLLQSISTLMIGVLLGWGIGAAGMRGALAARDQILLKSTLQKVQSRYIIICYPTTNSMY
jgi:hypothetical protein